MIGKKIMAGEPIIDFRTDEIVGWTRRRNIGIIEDMTDDIVKVYNEKHLERYQRYELRRKDFDKWVNEKLYIIK